MNLENAIEEIVNSHPTGIQRKNLELELRIRHFPESSSATLKRILARLIAENRIVAEGKSVARIYKPISTASDLPAIQLSSEALDVQSLIRRPIPQRTPVGYHPDFLESYEPNQTTYLDPKQTERLHALGRSNMQERPAGTYARDILTRLLVDLAWASSHLEGNTYTLLDTRRLIEEGITASGKSARDAQMILNHKRAIELLVEDADNIGFNSFTLRNLHATLSEALMTDSSTEGRLRTRVVEIEGSVFHPLPVPQQIEEQFHLVLQKADAIKDPFEQAFFVMVHIPYLQPFEDVNKRVSRLAANIPFIRENLCPLSFMDVPNDLYVEGLLGVYENNRIELLRDVFVWAYERSCQLYPIKKAEVDQPDPLKLKYRPVLQELVQMHVYGELSASAEALKLEVQKAEIAGDDADALVKLALKEIRELHEGNFARYGIRPSEFMRWQLQKNLAEQLPDIT